VKDIATLDLGGNFHGSLFGMILDAGLMVKFVLLLLLIFSVVSLAIIFLKYKYYRNVKKENELFYSEYMKSSKLSDVLPAAKKYTHSTTAEVFRAGYSELTKSNITSRESAGRSEEIGMSSLDKVERSLNKSIKS